MKTSAFHMTSAGYRRLCLASYRLKEHERPRRWRRITFAIGLHKALFDDCGRWDAEKAEGA